MYRPWIPPDKPPGYVPPGNEWVIGGNYSIDSYLMANASYISLSLI